MTFPLACSVHLVESILFAGPAVALPLALVIVTARERRRERRRETAALQR